MVNALAFVWAWLSQGVKFDLEKMDLPCFSPSHCFVHTCSCFVYHGLCLFAYLKSRLFTHFGFTYFIKIWETNVFVNWLNRAVILYGLNLSVTAFTDSRNICPQFGYWSVAYPDLKINPTFVTIGYIRKFKESTTPISIALRVWS